MTVDRDDLERSLREARAIVEQPVGGIHGPGSLSWRVNREAILFLGGGRAALLQLAHPFVAHGVDQHSATRSDIAGRFQRTFTHVYNMSFGPWEKAERAARRVHAVHEKVTGEIREDVGRYRHGHRYEANDEHALLWVYATLVDSALLVYERTMRPLAADERERYLADSWAFAKLFGIPASILPPTWADFRRYFDGMLASDALAVGAPALSMSKFLLTAPTPALVPAVRLVQTVTAGLLPERFRREFELPFGALDRAVFAATMRAIGPAYRALPRRLRYVPAYVEAVRRARGEEPRDRFGRFLERLVIRGVVGSPRAVAG